MAYPSDYHPVAIPEKVVELRIHGVAGTPPEGLLKKPPVLVAGDEKSGFYRADPHATLEAGQPGIVEAYSWGALTAGTRFSAALRILLLPFSVVNVAGWMVPGIWDPDAEASGRGPTRPGSSGVPWQVRLHVLASRLLALVLTLYAVLGTYWLTLKVMSVVTWAGVERLSRFAGVNLPGNVGTWLREFPADSIRVHVAFALTLVMVLVWARVSKRRHVVGEGTVAGERLTDIAIAPVAAVGTKGDDGAFRFDIASLWTASAITKTLGRLHLLAALIFLTVLHASIAASSAPGGSWWYLALLIPVLAIGAMSWSKPAKRLLGSAWLRVLTALAVMALVAAIVVAALLSHDYPAPKVGPESFGTTTQLFAFVIAVITALLVTRILLAAKGAPFWTHFYSAAFTIVGFGTAIIGYVGGAVVLIALVAREDWSLDDFTIAIALAVLGLGSVLLVLACVMLSWNPLKDGGKVDWAVRLRATTARVRGFIVAGATFYSLSILAIFGCWFGANRSRLSAPEEQLEGFLNPIDPGAGNHWAALGWIFVSTVVGALIVAPWRGAGRPWGASINASLPTDPSPAPTPDPPAPRQPRFAGSIGRQSVADALLAIIAGAVVLVAAVAFTALVRTWASDNAAAFSVKWRLNLDSTVAGLDDWFAYLAIGAAMIAPVVGMIWYVTSLSSKADARRIVGVLWDLTNFWPRHFHPWAPQPYADRTVPDVARRIKVLQNDDSVARVVVSAHSQGANTALPVMLTLSGNQDAVDGKLSLMTYGVLLNSHYRWLFPWIFNPLLTEDLNSRLGNRWRNLYRITDPLGHPIPDAGGVEAARQRLEGDEVSLPIGLGNDHPVTMLHSDYQYSPQYETKLGELS